MNVEQAVSYLANNLIPPIMAIIVIAGIIRIIKPIGVSVKKFLFAELYAADAKHDIRLDKLELRQLKQTICDRRLPIEDRLEAGDEYIARGKNGGIKIIYESLQEAAKKKLLEEQEQRDQREQEKRREV
jgi:hypothetical protein